ncbi:hypothetical protein [Azospirillum largimobile]
MNLISPDANSSRSIIADWLELSALNARNKTATRAALDGFLRITTEENEERRRRNPITNEPEDGEIAEVPNELRVSAALQEIQWRSEVLGGAYPFELIRGAGGVGAPWELKAPENPSDPKVVVYVTCLLISAYRRNLIAASNPPLFTNHKLGLIFQICACLAIGGYIDGDVVSFGWPRAEGTAFLPALRAAWKRFDAYNIIADIPDGYPDKLKDGGIDVIAWRHFCDRRPSRLLVFGQAASGDDWQEKSVQLYAQMLVSNWFSGARPGFWIPATLMPFIAHEDATVEDGKTIETTIKGSLMYAETHHGLVFDRIRVCSSALSVIDRNGDQERSVDGYDRIEELSTWVEAVIAGKVVAPEERAA